MSATAWSIFIPTLVLIIGMVDDLKARKVHNWLVLVLAAFSALAIFLLFGFSALKMGALSMAMAFAVCLPLVLLKIMGAGDMKLLMAFAISVAPMAVFWVVIYSFAWGALLGILQILLKKEGASFLNNMMAIVLTKGQGVSAEKLHKIPFTIALFFGWLTQLSLTGFNGLLS